MIQIMQAGKIYRMRPVEHQPFTEGYFQDNCFFEGGAFHVGEVARDSAFIYRVNPPDGSPKLPNDVAGHVVGLTLTLVDGTIFELVEQPAYLRRINRRTTSPPSRGRWQNYSVVLAPLNNE